ncbi:MAG: beta-N-acetylglucosaminidase domain-containing protein [Nocardiopsaceae bacterium]|nr:beta-N-acetylglucosaminidase domain-containing protein [Nocardiopsaceae bacterium]
MLATAGAVVRAAAVLMAAVGMVMATAPQAAAGNTASIRSSTATPRALPSVYPAPRQMTPRPGFVTLPATVGEVVGQHTDGPALREVNSVLKRAGVRHVVTATAGQPAPKAPVVVYVGGPSENAATAGALASLHVAGPEGLPSGGYALGVGREQGSQEQGSQEQGSQGWGTGVIALSGVDGTGTFYAAQTLRQLIQGRQLHDVAVKDWPSMPIRGVIEGFYGPPWSTADRISALRFDGRNKMNTYVYSPKDDPYLRARWREPYPPAKLAVIKHLIDAANANHVNFTYALSPGLSICFSSESDINALITKLQSIWNIGARAFAIPFDDVSESSWNCAADTKAFGPPSARDVATAQAHVLNAVQSRFIATHPGAAPLEFVPTEYSDTAASPYKQVISSQLDPSVVVEWTGDGVIVPTITAAQAKAARQVYGHDILIWDNYPVNDYITNRLLMGPYTGRGPHLGQAVTGITANPMIEEEASKVALFTAASYFWNTAGYDPHAAWLAGIKAIGGRAWPALQVLADNDYSSTLNPRESPDLTRRIDPFWKAWDDHGNMSGPALALLAYFARMAAAPGQLRAGLHDPDFLSEVGPWLGKLGRYGQAGAAAVKMLLAERAGQDAVARFYRARVRRDQAALATIPQQVAPGVMDPFLARAMSAS